MSLYGALEEDQEAWRLGRRPRRQWTCMEPWKKTKRGGALEEDQEGWSLGRRPRRQWACMEPWKKTIGLELQWACMVALEEDLIFSEAE